MSFFNFLKKNNGLIILTLISIIYFGFSDSVLAEMQSSSYKIPTDSFNINGSGFSSPSYRLNDTVDPINIDNLSQIIIPPVVTPTGGVGSSGSIPKNNLNNNIPDTIPPGNPTNVKINSLSSLVSISWDNPNDIDFNHIRITRNTNRYYSNPLVGEVVYEGNGNSTTDINIGPNNIYFYTLFSVDTSGNYSSGSLISVAYKLSSSVPTPTKNNTEGNVTPVTPPVVEVYKPVPIEEVKQLPHTYAVTESGITTPFKIGDIVHLQINKPINVRIEYSPQSQNDDMWIEIIDENNTINKYFFSKTKDQIGFMDVNIPPFLTGGYYSVNIYKYNNDTPEKVFQGAFLLDNVPVQKNDFYSLYILPILTKILSIISMIIGFISSFWFKLVGLFR